MKELLLVRKTESDGLTVRLFKYGGIKIFVKDRPGAMLERDEIKNFAEQIINNYKNDKAYAGRRIIDINMRLDEDGDVSVQTNFEHVEFERVRRITGYLVGTLDRFNDGKRAEEHDRVKHTTEEE